jgi:hypothetical protein
VAQWHGMKFNTCIPCPPEPQRCSGGAGASGSEHAWQMLALLPPQRAQGPDPKLICFAEVTHVTFIHTPRPLAPKPSAQRPRLFPPRPLASKPSARRPRLFPPRPLAPKPSARRPRLFPPRPLAPKPSARRPRIFPPRPSPLPPSAPSTLSAPPLGPLASGTAAWL